MKTTAQQIVDVEFQLKQARIRNDSSSVVALTIALNLLKSKLKDGK